MNTKSWVFAGLTVVALAVGPAASPAAAGLWSGPATLGEDGVSAVGDAAVDRDGTAIVAWAATGGPVRAAVRPADAAFTPTVTLAPDGGQAAAAALDGRGGALVAWSRNGSLGLAERTRDAPDLTPVPTAVAGIQDGPDVAFIGTGEALIVWAGTDGAIHALSRELGGDTVALPNLAPGPGNSGARLGAAGGHAVATWTSTTKAGSQLTTRVRASVLAPGGSFGAAEDVASATSDIESPFWTGSNLTAMTVAVSEGGGADVLIHEVLFLGPPGEAAFAGLVAARPAGTWTAAQRLGGADDLVHGAQYDADVAAGSDGDALYVDGAKSSFVPTMTFSARWRAAGATPYGDASTLHAGAPGALRAAPLAASRYLVLLQSGTGLRSRAGSPTTGFAGPLVFSGTDASRLLELAGAPSGLAVAAWLTTAGRVHAAIYDDSLGPGSLPPPAARDTIAPVLSRLRVSPRRFAVRRPARTAARRGARIRWRLSEPARVTFRVDRVRPGFRRGRRCAVHPPPSGHVRRCARFARVGSFARVGQTGTTAVRFNGFIRRRALRPGPYRLTAIARDAVRNRAKAKRVRFTVVRP